MESSTRHLVAMKDLYDFGFRTREGGTTKMWRHFEIVDAVEMDSQNGRLNNDL